MAITTHKILKSGGAGEATGREATAELRSFEATYQLTSNDPLDGPNVALEYMKATSSTPWYGDPYQVGNDQYPNATVTSVNAARVGLSEFFNVAVVWEEAGGGGGSEPESHKVDLSFNRTSPLQWHDEIEISTIYISIPIRSAGFRGYFRPHNLTDPDTTIVNPHLVPISFAAGYRGPVVNSAVDPFDPEPEGEIPVEVLRITRNVFPWDDGLARLFRNTVNDSDVTISKPDYGFEKIIDKHTGRIIDITGTFQVDLEYKIKYWRITIEVHINPLGWRLVMTDKGMRRKALEGDVTEMGVTINANNIDTKIPPLTRITDPSGEKVYGPVLLDGTGKPAHSGGTLPPKPVLMKWEHYTEITWDGIPW